MRLFPPRRTSSHGGGGTRSRISRVLGIPIPIILIALLASALVGVLLTLALQQSTASRSQPVGTAVDSLTGNGKNPVGIPVVTETTLGTEVQRLVDTGSIQPMTSFDSAQCLREQGVPDSILILEEIRWGGEETPSWLLVHGPMDRDTLRANGGVVSATVVLPSCGTASDDISPDQNRLWAGDVKIGSL